MFVLDITVQEADPFFAALVQRTNSEQIGAFQRKEVLMQPPPNFAVMITEAYGPASA